MISGTLDAVIAHLSAATSAPEPVALLHLAQARTLLVTLEAATANARRDLEALEREHVRQSAALVVAGDRKRAAP